VKADGDAVTNYAQATASDTAAYARFFHAMLDFGVHLPPSQYEAWFVGLAHTGPAPRPDDRRRPAGRSRWWPAGDERSP
jgi:hypothetical protein